MKRVVYFLNYILLIFILCCNSNEADIILPISNKITNAEDGVKKSEQDSEKISILRSRLNNRLISYNNSFYFFSFNQDNSVCKIIINNYFEIVDLKKGIVTINSPINDYQFLFEDETAFFSFENQIYFLRYFEEPPELGQKLYYAFYNESEVEFKGRGYEETLDKINNSCLVIFENIGYKRYICMGDKIFFEIPLFADGPSYSIQIWSDKKIGPDNTIISDGKSRSNDRLDGIEEIRFFEGDPQPSEGEPFSYFLRIYYKNCSINNYYK